MFCLISQLIFIFFLSVLLLQTIKCLLIYPNPESALNEEAGKLLLEQYDTYFSRAKMMTEIHAQSHRSSKESRENEDCNPSTSGVNSQGPAPKKHAGDKKVALAEKKKKDKKRTLKRLWCMPRTGNDHNSPQIFKSIFNLYVQCVYRKHLCLCTTNHSLSVKFGISGCTSTHLHFT